MANTNFKDFVTNLGAASALGDADVVPVVQGGANKKATGAQIKAKGKEGLATVATSGSYNDLSDKPTIPGAPVTSVNSKTGAVVLTEDDIGAGTTNVKFTDTEKTKLAGLSQPGVATTSVAGLVKPGTGLTVAGDGTLNATGGGAVTSVAGRTGAVTLTEDDIAATSANLKFTSTLKTKLDGIATGANNYALPTATASVLGGIKIGSGLFIDGSGVVSATGGGSAGVSSLNSKTGAVTAQGEDFIIVDNSGSTILIGVDGNAFDEAIGDSATITSLSGRVAALEGSNVDQTTWDLTTAKQGGSDATTVVTVSSDGATATFNSPASGNNFVRVFGTAPIKSTDCVYFMIEPGGGGASDFGFGATTKDSTFNGVFLDGINNSGGNTCFADRWTEGKINIGGTTDTAYYDNYPAVDSTAWLFVIDRPNAKVFIKASNYPANFITGANFQNGTGAIDAPPGWGSADVFPFASWVFPATSTPATAKLVNNADQILAKFPGVDLTGYKPLGASDQTGTGTGTSTPDTSGRTGGKTSAYRAAALAPDLSTAQPSGGTNIAVPSAYQLWQRFGVNGHWLNTDYQNGATGTYNESRILAALNNLGFGVLRDSLPSDAAANQAAAVFSSISYLKMCLLTGVDNGQSKKTQVDRAASKLPANAVIFVEGTNEIDAGYFQGLFDDAYQVEYDYEMQGQTDRLARTDYLKTVPFAAPTFTQFYNAFEVAGAISCFDYGTCHPYPAGRNPEQTGFGGTFSGSNGAGSYSFSYGDRRLAFWGDANLLAPGKPVICAETGYTSTPGVPTGDGNLQDGNAAASYSIRDFMYLIKLGARLVCKYELIKQPIGRAGDEYEAQLGLVNNDGTMTTTATVLANFIKGIREYTTAAQTFVPGTLSYALGGAATTTAYLPSGAPTSGYGWTENVMSYAFQWSDGSWGIVIWRPSLRKKLPVRDKDGNIVEPAEYYAAPPGVACTITINGKTISGTPTKLDPAVSGTFGSTGISTSGNVITLSSLSDMPQIVKFTAA